LRASRTRCDESRRCAEGAAPGKTASCVSLMMPANGPKWSDLSLAALAWGKFLKTRL
jgi:hypothetical protein